MEILLNNNIEFIDAEAISVQQLLLHKNFTFRMLVIKINGQLVKKDQYTSAMIYHGDQVQVIHLVSGG